MMLVYGCIWLASYRFVIAPLDPDAVVSTWDLEALTECKLHSKTVEG